MNLGDLMQFWTSDRYKATVSEHVNFYSLVYIYESMLIQVHRVRVPEEELRRRKPRQSIAFFVNPDNGVEVAPLNNSNEHPTVESLAYLRKRLSKTYKY